MISIDGINKHRKEKAMRNPSFLALIIVIGFFATVVMGCSEATEITQAEAIRIAKEYVAADGVMTIDDGERESLVLDEGSQWHVYFPYKDTAEMLGGEPHVMVAKSDGTVTDIYYTQ
jgi:hypothetical protein